MKKLVYRGHIRNHFALLGSALGMLSFDEREAATRAVTRLADGESERGDADGVDVGQDGNRGVCVYRPVGDRAGGG